MGHRLKDIYYVHMYMRVCVFGNATPIPNRYSVSFSRGVGNGVDRVLWRLVNRRLSSV